MKKFVLSVVLILCTFCNLYGKSKKTVNLMLTYFFSLDTCTLPPLTESQLSFHDAKSYDITEAEKKKILKCLKNKKRVEFIEYPDIEIDLSFLDEENSSGKNKKSTNKQKKSSYQTIIKKISDEDIDVRLIAKFDDYKLVFGRSERYIKFNDEYYLISTSCYKRLVRYFLSLIEYGNIYEKI